MAPGIAPTAYAVASDVMAQIAQSMTARDGSGGSGGGDGQHHHYHGGGHSSTGASDSDSFTSSDSSSQFGGSHSKEGLVSQFLSGGSQDQRMGVLVTTSFSIVAAMIVIYSIMYDTYRVKPGDLYSRAQYGPRLNFTATGLTEAGGEAVSATFCPRQTSFPLSLPWQ